MVDESEGGGGEQGEVGEGAGDGGGRVVGEAGEVGVRLGLAVGVMSRVGGEGVGAGV